jgi:MOSC domain-containing protein YiiM
VWLTQLNLAGDFQADQRNHGGPDQALCVYCGVHYAYWSRQLGQELTAGSFGENLTLAGSWTEADVCIGDVFALGEAVVQVTQPRSPCWKIARRWQTPLLSLWMQETGYTGWYMRVLQPGQVAPPTAWCCSSARTPSGR